MNVLEAAQNLIDKILDVIETQWLTTINDSMKISFHEVLHITNVGMIKTFGVKDYFNK